MHKGARTRILVYQSHVHAFNSITQAKKKTARIGIQPYSKMIISITRSSFRPLDLKVVNRDSTNQTISFFPTNNANRTDDQFASNGVKLEIV